MARPLAIIVGVFAVSAALLAGWSSGATSASAGCGPGVNWIDGCPGGTDFMTSTSATLSIDTDGDCQEDEQKKPQGPTKVERKPAQQGQGGAPDTIDTEIVQMELTGGGVTLKVGKEKGLPPSPGKVEEKPDPSKGKSYFDWFFEFDMNIPEMGPDPISLFNQTALRVDAEIDQVPPQAVYTHAGPLCLPLYTSAIGGTEVVRLVGVEWDTGTSIGGTAGLVEVGGAPSSAASGSSGWGAATLAAAGAGAAIALAGVWYARRRWLG